VKENRKRGHWTEGEEKKLQYKGKKGQLIEKIDAHGERRKGVILRRDRNNLQVGESVHRFHRRGQKQNQHPKKKPNTPTTPPPKKNKTTPPPPTPTTHHSAHGKRLDFTLGRYRQNKAQKTWLLQQETASQVDQYFDAILLV